MAFPIAGASGSELDTHLSRLADKEGSLRREAATALGRIRGAKAGHAAKALVGALDDADVEVASAARRGLATIGSPAVPFLIQAAWDSEPRRYAALDCLGDIGPGAKDAVPFLIDASNSKSAGIGLPLVPHPIVRHYAGIPLAGSAAERAGIQNGDRILAINGTNVSFLTASEAANRIRTSTGTSVALTLWREAQGREFEVRVPFEWTPDYLGNLLAIQALGRIGPAANAALPALRKRIPQALADAGNYGEIFFRVLYSAAESSAQIAPAKEEEISELIGSLNESSAEDRIISAMRLSRILPARRVITRSLLGRLRAEKYASAIHRYLLEVIHKYGKANAEQSSEFLIYFLEHPELPFRDVIEGLKDVTVDKDQLDNLISALGQPEEAVRAWASSSLIKIGPTTEVLSRLVASASQPRSPAGLGALRMLRTFGTQARRAIPKLLETLKPGASVSDHVETLISIGADPELLINALDELARTGSHLEQEPAKRESARLRELIKKKNRSK